MQMQAIGKQGAGDSDFVDAYDEVMHKTRNNAGPQIPDRDACQGY